MRILFSNKISAKKGQSIVELLIAIGVGALILTTLSAGLILTISNARFSKQKTQAIKYLNEGVENVRIARDRAANWTEFKNQVWPDESLGEGVFTRKTTLGFEADKATVTVIVFWTDSKGDHQVSSTTFLSQW